MQSYQTVFAIIFTKLILEWFAVNREQSFFACFGPRNRMVSS